MPERNNKKTSGGQKRLSEVLICASGAAYYFKDSRYCAMVLTFEAGMPLWFGIIAI